MPFSELQLGLRALQYSEEGMILQTNVYENDKLLLDCFENFYNREKRAIAIYRLLKVKMGSCKTGLYSVFPPVIFYCTSLFRRPLCLLGTVCGWWYSICLHSWVLEALITKGCETFLLFRKVLLEFLMQSGSLKQNQALCYNRGCSFSREGEGSRLICLIEDASHSLLCWTNAICNFSVGGKAQEILDMSTWVLLPLGKVLSQPAFISLTLNQLRSGLTDLLCQWNLPPPSSSHNSFCSEARQHHCHSLNLRCFR